MFIVKLNGETGIEENNFENELSVFQTREFSPYPVPTRV